MLRGVGLAALALFLTIFFLILRFPTDVLGRTIASQISSRTGVQIVFGTLERRILGIKASDVRVSLPAGENVQLDTLRILPACSPTWLLGAPAFWIDVDADDDRGDIEGVVTLGTISSFVGELRSVDLTALPTESIVAGFSMTGRIDGNLDLVFEPGKPSVGDVSFQAKEGSVRAPNLPLPVPFDRLNGELALGGEQYALVHGLQIRGGVLDGDLEGTVGHAERSGRQPLDLDLAVNAKQPQVRSFLQQLGVRLDRDGRAKLDLTGTLANPTFR